MVFAECVNRAIPKQHNNKWMSEIQIKIPILLQNAFHTFNHQQKKKMNEWMISMDINKFKSCPREGIYL